MGSSYAVETTNRKMSKARRPAWTSTWLPGPDRLAQLEQRTGQSSQCQQGRADPDQDKQSCYLVVMSKHISVISPPVPWVSLAWGSVRPHITTHGIPLDIWYAR